MYKPKDSIRWLPKVTLPIRLDDQCLNVIFGILAKTAERVMNGRNIRAKKRIREYISENVPVCLQKRLTERIVNKLVGVQTTLNLLDLFDPQHIIHDRVDLLGPFRLGFGCYLKAGRLTWSQGSAKKFNMSVANLDQLYNILIWSNPARLEELRISVARDTIKLSKIPNIIAQARSLTRVTILSGAENHTLRILGLNCPCLLSLDISHSIRVTDTGLRNLLLKSNSRKRSRVTSTEVQVNNTSDQLEVRTMKQEEVNPCARIISSIVLVGTSVTWKGCEQACKAMNFGYFTSSLPFIKLVRVNQAGLIMYGQAFDRQTISSSLHSSFNEDFLATVFSSAYNTLLPDQLKGAVMDIFSLEYQKRSNSKEHSLVFIRDTLNNFKLHLHMKLESTTITTLVLPWYTFTWSLDSLVSLDTLGFLFPNLRHLKGRIKGRWSRDDEPLLPYLQAAYVWSLNSSTALSMLQNVPNMKFLEFNNTETLGVAVADWELTDETLAASLDSNKSLAKCLESFIIRPTRLTQNGLKTLTTKCPNLKRIGDLESWDIKSEQITKFNAYLDSVGSQCVLTIMNFPPDREKKYQWVF